MPRTVILLDGSRENSRYGEKYASQGSELKLCVEEETDVRECFQPSGHSTPKRFPYLLDVLLHKQQQVIEVIKNETGHLKKRKKRLSHKRGQTCLQ